mmetsp:Transcript_6405/g.16420  ORF Transcript_6405/g.16420 Transcript_6405/m.16420 type:complete len:301 (-) Transcript_6405:67-969(-)
MGCCRLDHGGKDGHHPRLDPPPPHQRCPLVLALNDLVFQVAKLLGDAVRGPGAEDVAHVGDVLFEYRLKEGHQLQQLRVVWVACPLVDVDSVVRLQGVAVRVSVDDDDVFQIPVEIGQVLDVLAAGEEAILAEECVLDVGRVLKGVCDGLCVARHCRCENDYLVKLAHVSQKGLQARALHGAMTPLPLPVRVDQALLQAEDERPLHHPGGQRGGIGEELPLWAPRALRGLHHPVHPLAEADHPERLLRHGLAHGGAGGAGSALRVRRLVRSDRHRKAPDTERGRRETCHGLGAPAVRSMP